MLAISTATKKALIALEVNGTRKFSELDADCRQSEKMMQEIDKMLAKNKLSLEDVGNFALVVGPGSFTGLRIGCALIKGFCAGQPHKVVPIPTLDLMAFKVVKESKPKHNFSCFMNALSGKYYAADYNKKGEKIKDERILAGGDVLKGKNDKYCFMEEAFLPFGVSLTSEDLLEYALKLESENKLISAKDISLKYIRKSAAEDQN